MFSNNLLADANDCFSKETAELLAKKSLNQYIMSYCDCCADNGGPKQATLLFVKSAKVVVCEYDDKRYSVEMEYDVAGQFSVDKGKLDANSFAATSEGFIPNKISLDYHFALINGKAAIMYKFVGIKNKNAICSSLDIFPALKSNKEYSKWLKSNKK